MGTEYIERGEAIDALKKDIMGGLNYRRILNSIPATDVQPVKHGRWKLHGEPPWYVRECSKCGEKWHHWQGYSMPNYCPNCGSVMDGET